MHIAVENISRLAVECLESNRLASYTEKSTRYQKWNSDDFHIPDEFNDDQSRKIFQDTCKELFSLYDRALPLVIDSLDEETPIVSGESPARRKRILLTAAGDVCRFLLPVSAFANVGMTINARALEHAITKMLSHPLQEVRALGNEIKEISRVSLPTLLKYANEQASLTDTSGFFESLPINNLHYVDPLTPGAYLRSYDQDAEELILIAAIMRYQNVSYAQSRNFINNLTVDQKKDLLSHLTGNLKDHDIPIRELEYGNFLFEVVLDEGAYLELKRHRMMAQTPSPFTPSFGYAIPRQFQKAGLLDEYISIMQMVQKSYEELSAYSQHAAAYILPNAFNRHVLLQSNFRSLFHFLSLRTAPNAHFSMRRIAHQMADQVKNVFPGLGNFLRINQTENANEIEEKFFQKV